MPDLCDRVPETVGSRLAAHPDVRKIGFTGSTEVGKSVQRAAADNLKKVTLELGGKGPNIILDDAELDMAIDGSIFAFLMYSGQVCESGTRLLVPESRQQEARSCAGRCERATPDPPSRPADRRPDPPAGSSSGLHTSPPVVYIERTDAPRRTLP